MRVAVLLTGFCRTFGEVYPSIEEHLIKKYNADVFITTWNRRDNRNTKQVLASHVTHDDFKNVMNLRACSIFDIENYQKNRIPFVQNSRPDDVMVNDPRAIEHGEFWANRLRDQWYLVNQGSKSILDKYDVVVRSRLDIAFRKIVLTETEELHVPKDSSGVWDFSDHMAFGNHRVMGKYCSFYEHMQNAYDKHNVDPTHATEFIKFYMTEYEPAVKYVTDPTISYGILLDP